MNTKLGLFLEDPKTWVQSEERRPISILPPFSTSGCKETWIRSDEYPYYTPADGGHEKTYALYPKSDAIYRIECVADYVPAIDGLGLDKDVWVYSTLRLTVPCQESIPVGLLYPPVKGSLVFIDCDSMETPLNDRVWNHETKELIHTANGFFAYSPVFSGRVERLEIMSPDGSILSKWRLEIRIKKNEKTRRDAGIQSAD